MSLAAHARTIKHHQPSLPQNKGPPDQLGNEIELRNCDHETLDRIEQRMPEAL
jgi:hypothetical protein